MKREFVEKRILGLFILAVIFLLGCSSTPVAYNQVEKPTPSRPQNPVATVETHDIFFELISCTLDNQSLYCTLAITNKGLDRKITIFNATPFVSFFDYSGTQYPRARKLLFIPGVSSEYEISTKLFYDRTVFASVIFQVKPDIGAGKQLQIPLGGDLHTTVTFYDFPIHKKERDGSVTVIPVPQHVVKQEVSDPPKKDVANESKVVIKDDFKNVIFELQECRLNRQELTCTFLVSNKGSDTTLYIFNNTPNTTMYDGAGRQYARATALSLANKTSEYEVEHLIFNDIPVKATIMFRVPPDISKVKQLEVPIRVGKSGARMFFRDMPITQ